MSTSTIHVGDCRDVLATLPDASIDSIVTDPPYELGFMGKAWDATGIANNVDMWRECLRVLKPGGHLLAFSGSRTYHRMACAIEDAGFEIRDQIMWVYGSGFPKSLDVSKAIDKAAGAEREITAERSRQGRSGGILGKAVSIVQNMSIPATPEAEQWQGWGTALKPAHEPIVLARKPLIGTVAANVLAHGTGALNIDGCRIPALDGVPTFQHKGQPSTGVYANGLNGSMATGERDYTTGRWPANFIHDGSDEVTDLFPNSQGGAYPAKRGVAIVSPFSGGQDTAGGARVMGDTGSAARFFYCAKASKTDRNEGLDGFEEQQQDLSRKDGNPGGDNPRNRGLNRRANHHPTVKPTDLMRYLCRLITPPNGVVFDPFTGSGSTGKAAILERFSFIGIEQDKDYAAIAEARIKHALDSREETLFND